jgi:hypothetical protein
VRLVDLHEVSRRAAGGVGPARQRRHVEEGTGLDAGMELRSLSLSLLLLCFLSLPRDCVLSLLGEEAGLAREGNRESASLLFFRL